MANVQGEKNLAASIPEGLVDAFWATVPKGFKNKHVLEAAAEIWINIPEADRLELLVEKLKSENAGSTLKKIVSGVLAERDVSAAQGAHAKHGRNRKARPSKSA